MRWRDPPLGLVLAIAAACLAPFAGKALHVDDPIFVWGAQHVVLEPLDPWGFTRVWGGFLLPAHRHVMHGPLQAYVLWLGSRLFGWSEPGLHVIVFAIALAALAGTFRLARRLGAPPGLAALAMLATPAFLVSSTTLMSDPLFLATWVWAVAAWVRGMDTLAGPGDPGRRRRAHAALALAALAASACALTRFNGVALVPLLAAHGLAARRRPGAWALWLLVPAAAGVAYQAHAYLQHGEIPLRVASAYVPPDPNRLGPGLRVVVGLVFAGGSLASAALLAALASSRRALVSAAGLAVVAALFTVAGGHRLLGFVDGGPGASAAAVQIGPWLALGALVLALAAAEWARTRDAAGVLLLLWVGGVFAFATLFNWTVNARSLLPMAPAAAILVGRRLVARRGAEGAWGGPALALLGFAALLALGVAVADLRHANAARDAAREALARVANERGTRWAGASWGLQFYLEEGGVRSYDVRFPRFAPGDVVVAPLRPEHATPLARSGAVLESTLPPRPLGFLATTDAALGAGFYANAGSGPLPFAFGRSDAPEIGIFRVTAGGPGVRR